VVFPAGHDPADILCHHGPEALARILGSRSQPLADLVTGAEVARWDRWLRHAEGRISALRAIAPLIAAMPPAHVGHQVARLADQLGLDHATVTEAVTDAVADVVAARRTAGETTAPQGDLRGRAPTAIRVWGQDSPNSAAGHRPPGRHAPSRDQASPADAARAGLRARRVPG